MFFGNSKEINKLKVEIESLKKDNNRLEEQITNLNELLNEEMQFTLKVRNTVADILEQHDNQIQQMADKIYKGE